MNTGKSCSSSLPVDLLAEDLEVKLLKEYGPILSGETLQRSLGFRSIESLRQAISRGTVGVPVFPLEHRRGKYALAKDVARWLAEKRAEAGEPFHQMISNEKNGGD